MFVCILIELDGVLDGAYEYALYILVIVAAGAGKVTNASSRPPL